MKQLTNEILNNLIGDARKELESDLKKIPLAKILKENSYNNDLCQEELKSEGSDFNNVDFRNVIISSISVAIYDQGQLTSEQLPMYSFWLRKADLRQTNFRYQNLFQVMLKEADLSESDLRNTQMIGTYLTQSKLIKADLRGANLDHVNADNADFTEANLILSYSNNADFARSDFTGSNLSYSSMKRANFTDANLQGADFTGADLTGARFNKANLTDVNLRGTIIDDKTLNEDFNKDFKKKREEQAKNIVALSWVRLSRKLGKDKKYRIDTYPTTGIDSLPKDIINIIESYVTVNKKPLTEKNVNWALSAMQSKAIGEDQRSK